MYAAHIRSGFTVPAVKAIQQFGNGMLAKQGLRRARRSGLLAGLTRLAR
ncbi:hypothetical protein [Catenuloplanes japonicus]|nr:hypothetical protein [Catenuloplanes japonicus]